MKSVNLKLDARFWLYHFPFFFFYFSLLFFLCTGPEGVGLQPSVYINILFIYFFL